MGARAKQRVEAHVSGCDNSPELRARLRGSPRQERRVHDFNNRLVAYACAVQDADSRLAGFYAGELTGMYCEAMDGNRNQEKPQGAAAQEAGGGAGRGDSGGAAGGGAG